MFKLLSSLAVTNLKKNHSLYLPFGLATVMVTMISYIVHALSSMPELSTLRGGSSIALSLGLGVIVIQIVALLIVLYANSFVMKNRSKEFGLYGILGLDRKNVQILSFMELFLFALVSVTAGIALGMVFHRFAFAVLLKLIQYPIGLEYHLQIGSVFFVYIFMGVIFLIVFFLNATKIYTSRPLELLKTKKFGETKGRVMKTRAVIGFVILGLAYYMSQTIESPMAAIVMFFVAVVMVVIATYILFDAGSIAILSALQKNKKLFYQPTNFISISNLKFRMCKNAAGLASVCILSTMVLVTLGTTVSLQAGAFKTLNESYPTEYSASSFLTSKEEEAEASKVEIRTSGIIYHITEDIEKALAGMLEPEYKEEYLGRIEIKKVFKVSKIGNIAGCIVIDGKVRNDSNIRILRDNVVIYEGKLASLKRFKDDAKEVVAGQECGLGVENFNDIKDGDVVEAFEMVEVKRTLK